MTDELRDIPRFDRTGAPTEHVYDLGPELLTYTAADGRRMACWPLPADRRCPSDPTTARLCLMLEPDGRPVLWGEFEGDGDEGDRCWIREGDEVARDFAAIHAELLDAAIPLDEAVRRIDARLAAHRRNREAVERLARRDAGAP